MTSDYRITSSLIHDILDALERHGYYRSDDQHADRALGLLGDMARIYEGTQEYPAGAYLLTVPSARSSYPEPNGQVGQHTVTLADSDLSTVLTALDVAADYKRDRAELCADCADQSCLACRSRLRDAQAYDSLAAHIDQAADARAAHRDNQPGRRALAPDRADPAPGREAGQ